MLKLDGAKLKKARLDKGSSQQEVASAAGISEVTYIRAESSETIHGSTARAICAALDIVLADVRIQDDAEEISA